MYLFIYLFTYQYPLLFPFSSFDVADRTLPLPEPAPHSQRRKPFFFFQVA